MVHWIDLKWFCLSTSNGQLVNVKWFIGYTLMVHWWTSIGRRQMVHCVGVKGSVGRLVHWANQGPVDGWTLTV